MKKAFWIILCAILIFALGVTAYVFIKGFPKEQVLGSLVTPAKDIVGSKVGTTTTGVNFPAFYASTTTYPTYIGYDIDTAIYTFSVTDASTTAGVNIGILSSQDVGCETSSTTSGIMNPILKSNIKWFDATNAIVNVVGSRSALTQGTSTIQWLTSGGKGTGRQIILTELAYRCLALQISASSTSLWIQLATKQK